MARGKVIKIDKENKKIQLDKVKDWILVGKKVINSSSFEEGDTIEYEMKGANFNFKRVVSSLENDNRNNYGRQKNYFQKNNGKAEVFSYPYNFVSLGNPENINRKPFEKGNISGKLLCTLENLTPIFTPSQDKKDINGHTREFFLCEEAKENKKKYIIPASSLKGEVRNIIEVLTTSCIKNVGNDRLEKREMKPLKYFGIIKRLPTEETSGLIVEANKVKISRNLIGKIRGEESKYLKEGFQKIKVNFGINRYISSGGKNDPVIDSMEIYNNVIKNGAQDAILWVSSSISNKKNEKIIYEKQDGRRFEFTKEQYDDLIYLINQRKEREEKNKKAYYIKELTEYEPIIIELDDNDKIINLAFSELPRLRYKMSPYELVPKDFKSCNSRDKLCFACRLFGTTGNSNEEKEDNSKNSLMGRVEFTDAEIMFENAKIVREPQLIKSLGEPHPTLAGFYLENGTYDDENSTIRGRKFYWHHSDKIQAGKNWKEYYEKSLKPQKEERHNSSIQFMEPFNKFSFEVKFNDLTAEELGVLIYGLELENGLLHKIGKAKALGFGSSKITIDKFLLEDENRYKSFIKVYKDGDKNEYVDVAKEKYIKDSKKEIKELKYILSKENSLDFSQSPFPEDTKKGKMEKNTLNWFMNRKRELRENFKLPHILDYKK